MTGNEALRLGAMDIWNWERDREREGSWMSSVAVLFLFQFASLINYV